MTGVPVLTPREVTALLDVLHQRCLAVSVQGTVRKACAPIVFGQIRARAARSPQIPHTPFANPSLTPLPSAI